MKMLHTAVTLDALRTPSSLDVFMKSHPPRRVSALLISLGVSLSIGLTAQQLPNPPGDQIPTTENDLSSTLGTPSFAFGINDIGTIVGGHVSDSSVHTPFLPFRWSSQGLQDLKWTAPPGWSPRLCIDSPSYGPLCRGLAVNNNDEVVGDWWGDPEVPWGLLWLHDEATEISLGTAYAVNDATTVVGFNTVCFLCPFADRWTPSKGREYLDPGAPSRVAPESEARAIRNDGVVAGWHCLDLRPFCDDFQGAVVWQPDGSVTELGFGIINAISDRSLAVGRSSGLSGYPLTWHNGTAIQIAPAGEAFDVNEAGYVVGTINVLGEPHAFVWHEARGLQDLGPGEARGIDEAGNIVGWRTTDGVRRATLWQAELRVEDLFIGLEAIAGRLLAGIDGSQAEKALRDISRARDAWTNGDSKRARQRLRQALDAIVKLNRSGELSDVRATAVLSLGNMLANRL